MCTSPSHPTCLAEQCRLSLALSFGSLCMAVGRNSPYLNTLLAPILQFTGYQGHFLSVLKLWYWLIILVLIVRAKNVYILRYHARGWVWQRGNTAWYVCAFQLYQSSKISADDRIELDQICSEHIASSVDLRWHIVSSGVRGRVSLKGITLTPEMLDFVRTSPLQWGRYFFLHLYHSVTRFIRSGNLLS